MIHPNIHEPIQILYLVACILIISDFPGSEGTTPLSAMRPSQSRIPSVYHKILIRRGFVVDC